MNEKPWLRQVLADARADRASWPEWARVQPKHEGTTSPRRAAVEGNATAHVPQNKGDYSRMQRG